MKIERLIAVAILLLRRDKVTGKELAELFGVSIRTIYRDIDTLNMAGIPIVTVSGAGGGIWIMEQYKIDKGIFTARDITAMLMGLGVISQTLSAEEAANALVKLKSFVPEEQVNEINLKMKKVMFDLSSWQGGDGSGNAFDLTRSALENNRVLSFNYFGHSGKEEMRNIEPHRLVFKGGSWYLQGCSSSRQDFRLFKIRRMTDVQIGSESFMICDAPHPFNDFTENMRSKAFTVKLLVERSALDRILDYCTIDDITQSDDGKLVVRMNFTDDDYGYGILMSFGNQLVCLEPDFVRYEMRKRLCDMIQQYE